MHLQSRRDHILLTNHPMRSADSGGVEEFPFRMHNFDPSLCLGLFFSHRDTDELLRHYYSGNLNF